MSLKAVIKRVLGPPPSLRLRQPTPLSFADNSVDIALTSVTLVCVGPEAIAASLDEIVRVTWRWLSFASRRANAAAGTPILIRKRRTG